MSYAHFTEVLAHGVSLPPLLAGAALVMLSACGGGGNPDPEAAQEPLRVFIFAGQSNMAGADATITADRTSDLAEAGLQTDADRRAKFSVRAMGVGQGWGDIRGHAGYSMGEFTVNGRPVKVHGPEVGFNRSLGSVAIIKYADNYHALENGRSAWVAPGSRWVAWQAFVDSQLASLGQPYEVAGFVWHQGIDDALLGRSRASYEADLRKIAADLRAKWGNKPFILARSVNSPLAGPAMAPIREAQVAVASDPNNAWIDTDDLGPYVQEHHLSAAGQLVAGQRFANEYIRLR